MTVQELFSDPYIVMVLVSMVMTGVFWIYFNLANKD
jgi:hypothetical protein